jgi:hypothetical protein
VWQSHPYVIASEAWQSHPYVIANEVCQFHSCVIASEARQSPKEKYIFHNEIATFPPVIRNDMCTFTLRQEQEKVN